MAARIPQTAAVLAATSCVPTSGSTCGLGRTTAGYAASDSGEHQPGDFVSGLPRSDKGPKDLWAHQADVLRDYLAHVDDADLAIELPTGAGKTLVGMLASHSSRPHPDGLIWPSVGPDLPELRLVKISPYIGWICCEPTGLNST